MSFTTDLLTGIATLLAANGAGTYRADGTAYTATDTAIVLKDMLPDPDRQIVLNAYTPVASDPSMPLATIAVQVRCRGKANPRTDVDDLADTVYQLLHGLVRTVFGSVTAIQVLHKTSVPMGMDTAKRWERMDNYFIDVDLPPTPNRPDQGFW